MGRITAILLVIMGCLLIYTSLDLPPMGDLNSPPSQHVSPRYIEMSYKETGFENMVGGVLADYRGYDTLGETVVIFTAGIAALIILDVRNGGRKKQGS